MSSLLGLVVRFSRCAPCTFRPAVSFSSTSTLFDTNLSLAQETVKEFLREKGLHIINVRSSIFTKGDIEAMRVSFQSASCNNQIIPEDKSKYPVLLFILANPVLTIQI